MTEIVKPFDELPHYSVLRCWQCGAGQLVHDTLLPDALCLECGARLLAPVAAPPADPLAQYAREWYGENE